MQEAMIQIGDAILKNGSILDNLVQELNPVRKNKNLYVLKMNYITKEEKLILDCKEEMNEKTPYKYLYIGSAAGAASKQWYVSSTNILYHITETFPNLTEIDLGEKLNSKISQINEKFYVDLGESFKSTKNRYILNFKKFGMGEDDVKTIYEEIKNQVKERIKNEEISEKDYDKEVKGSLKKNYTKIFQTYIKDILNISPNQIGLYTILIDGKPLCSEEEYRQAILKDKSSGDKKVSKAKDEYCSICGKKENLTWKIQTDIKFYTTNQIIFASNLNKTKGYKKNMLMCQECLNKILVAEKYIINNLTTSLSRFSVYIIPHFVIGKVMNKEELDICSKKIKNSFNTVKNFDSIEQLREEIINSIYMEEEQDNSYFLLNFIFYKKVQKATKVQRLIKDVNPSIFIQIAKALNQTYNISHKLMGENYNRKISLGKLYNLISIREKSGEAMQYKNMLQFYNNILTKENINKKNLIDSIIRTCKIQYFEEEGYNTSKGYINNTIVDGNMYIKFLQYLGCVKEGEGMDYTTLKVDINIKNYIKEMKYTEPEAALFLMGYLIGSIGNAQVKRSTENKKPILNKLNFGGMDKGKLVRLTGEIFNKLEQEKVRKYNEINFSECKRLMDKNFNSWPLSKHENLFYILSGYGYATTRPMFNKRKEGIKNEQ